MLCSRESLKFRKMLCVLLDFDWYPARCCISEWDETTGEVVVISDGSGGASHEEPGPYSTEVSTQRLREYLENWEIRLWQEWHKEAEKKAE